MDMPVHACSSSVIYMYPVHSTVGTTSLGVFRKDHRQGNKTAFIIRLTIVGPAFQDRDSAQVRIFLLNYLLARRRLNLLWEVLGKFYQFGQKRKLFDKTLGRSLVKEVLNPACYVIKLVDFK